METHAQEPPHPQAVVLQMAMSAMISQALGVAAKLGIADVLNDGPKTAAEIAVVTGTHERSIYRILRTLASTGVFSETGEKQFRNTALSDVLRSDVPGSMKNMAAFMAEPWHFAVLANLLYSAQTGETAFEKTLGEGIFQWFAKHDDESELFNKAMTDMSSFAAPGIVQSYDFSGINVLADIAGGTWVSTVPDTESQRTSKRHPVRPRSRYCWSGGFARGSGCSGSHRDGIRRFL